MTTTEKISFLDLAALNGRFKDEMQEAFTRVLDKGWFIMGGELAAFEQSFAAYCNAAHCLGVGNGLEALHLCLKALKIGPGDEVIVPSHTFIATWMAVSYTGATIVPVEVSEETFNLDETLVERAITPRTKAIIPVHLYGLPCRMDELLRIAKAHGLYVVEDNAQAQGATFQAQVTGSFGHVNATSFYPGKNLGALGDGGAVTTSDAALAAEVGMLRNYGSSKKYYHEQIGVNSRLDELQAAFLSVKLRRLEEDNRLRREAAAWYNERLQGIAGIRVPACPEDREHVYHLYVIQAERREALQQFLSEKNIQTIIHYPVAIHLQQAYADAGWKKGDFPIAERLAGSVLSLPVYPGITKEEVDYVADSVAQFYRG